MNRPESFKYDTRIRQRMVAAGLLADAELREHLAKLPNVEAACDTVTLEQPALMSVKEPEPMPPQGLLGMGVPALSPIEPAPRVSALEPGAMGGRHGLGAAVGPAPKVSPFEPAPRPSSMDSGVKLNPFEPAPLVSPYEPAPRINAYEAPRAPEAPTKVDPFEPAQKISPFESPYLTPSRDAMPPARPPAAIPPAAPPVPPFSPPAYTPAQSSLHAQPPITPHASPLGQSSLGHAPLVSPFEPSSLGAPFQPTPPHSPPAKFDPSDENDE